jgi:hypothetical protein
MAYLRHSKRKTWETLLECPELWSMIERGWELAVPLEPEVCIVLRRFGEPKSPSEFPKSRN